MNRDQRRIAFLKVLIAAAWADEKLSPAEIRTLSYYLQRFSVTPAEYEALKPLLERPIPPADAQQLVQEQLAMLTGTEEQRTLVAAVEDLLAADDRLAPSEADFLRELRKLTSNPPTVQLFVNRLNALWSTTSPQPTKRLAGFDQFFQQRLLQHFRSRIALARARSGITASGDTIADRDLYHVVIWASLLVRVAEANRSLCPAEKQQLLDILAQASHLPRPDLEVITDACFDDSLAEINLNMLVRAFVSISSTDESSLLLDCMFLVAAADGKLEDTEVNVIRDVSRSAGFTEQAFQTSLSRCQRRLEAGWN